METLKCHDCDKPGRWYTWYKDVTLPIGQSGNIVYNTFCDEHAIAELRNGRVGCQVACLKLIADSLLPDDDRAKVQAET